MGYSTVIADHFLARCLHVLPQGEMAQLTAQPAFRFLMLGQAGAAGAAVAGRPACPPSSGGIARNGWPAASEHRPSSRIEGRWRAGSGSIRTSTAAWGGISCAQRAPGRQPPPRGTEQAPGSSSTGRRGGSRGSGGASGRSFRRSRSMASCGRKSEATLGIAGLHDKSKRIAAALARECKAPAGACQADCAGQGRHAAHPPARHGG